LPLRTKLGMILGVGVDIAKNKRFASWLRNEKKILRFFHKKEIDFSKITVQMLASRFAAKEAFVKALGIGFHNIELKSIAVLKNAKGQPYFYLEGEAKKAFERLGGEKVHLSLSHEKEYAIAFVVIEARGIENSLEEGWNEK
jgi:holo-[acyl-carrier protein] synthase